MPYPRKEYRNQAIVILHKAGMSFYAICKAFGRRDKRNFIAIWERDKDKHDLPIKDTKHK